MYQRNLHPGLATRERRSWEKRFLHSQKTRGISWGLHHRYSNQYIISNNWCEIFQGRWLWLWVQCSRCSRSCSAGRRWKAETYEVILAMILLLRVFVLNFCTSPGTSWSQRKLRRMSFGETTSTELVLPSRALSWHLLRQSQPLLLPSQPTPIPQPIGKKQWNLWISQFQSSIKCWNAGTEISKFCTLLHSTGPWMMLRMEVATKRTSSSLNSKRC